MVHKKIFEVQESRGSTEPRPRVVRLGLDLLGWGGGSAIEAGIIRDPGSVSHRGLRP